MTMRAAIETDGEVPRPKMLRLLTTSEAATDRATKLTRQLLAFARRETLQFGVVTLDKVIVGCEPFLRRALGETNTLKRSFEACRWPTRIDAARARSCPAPGLTAERRARRMILAAPLMCLAPPPTTPTS